MTTYLSKLLVAHFHFLFSQGEGLVGAEEHARLRANTHIHRREVDASNV